MDDDDLRKVRTVTDELGVVLLLEGDTHEAFLLVGVKLCVVAHDLGYSDGLETCQLCKPWIILAVLLLEVLEVVDSELGEMLQVVLHFVHLVLYASELLIDSLCIELRNLPDWLFYELVDILHGDIPLEKSLELEHLGEYFVKLIFPGLCITLKDLVDLVLEENLLERAVVPVVLELIESDLELLSKETLCVVCAVSENLVHRKELRLVVHDDAGVRRDRNLAVCKRIKRIYGLVRRHIVRKMDHDLCLVSCKVINLLDLDLALFLCLEDRINDDMGCLAKWYLVDRQCILVYLLNLGTDFYDSSALALHVL